jgi:hypothetical protein
MISAHPGRAPTVRSGRLPVDVRVVAFGYRHLTPSHALDGPTPRVPEGIKRNEGVVIALARPADHADPAVATTRQVRMVST